MVGKCEQQRSLIIGSPSGYRVDSYRGIFQSKTDLHRQIMRLCAITTKQLSHSSGLRKTTEESDKSLTFICYTALEILAMYVVFRTQLLGP